MAGKDDDVNDENIFDEGEMEDDGTAELIRNALKDDDDDVDDDGGFDQPLDAKTGEEPDVVSPDEGRDLLDDADMAKSKGKNPGEKDDPAPEDKTKTGEEDPAKAADAAKEGKEGDEGQEGKTEDKPDLTAADVDSLLDGVPDDRKGEITRRLSEADSAMAPFSTDYAKAELARFGATPKEMASRLVDLASFAAQKPDEYLAWAAREMASSPDKVGEVLSAAAKLHGYKLVKEGAEDDDDDLFLDPEVKKLKEENARLKAAAAGTAPEYGPDTPERQQQRSVQEQLQSFVTERDETGQLKRPLFDKLQPRIAQMAMEQRTRTGQAVTAEDLGRLYDQAAEEMRQAFGAPAANPGNGSASAAQPGPSVSDQMKAKAAAAEKAKRASKSVDGTGQGASRRPALSDDAPLDDVIRHFASQD